MLDGTKGVREKRMEAKRLIQELREKLSRGWSPWQRTDGATCSAMSVRTVVYAGRMPEMAAKTLESVEAEYAQWNTDNRQVGIIRRWTYLDRKSQLSNFMSWAKTVGLCLVTDIDRPRVVAFLDHVLFERRVSIQTRNNYRAWLYHFCEWLMQRGYLKENPVKGIKKLRVGAKCRKSFTADELVLLVHYVESRCDAWFKLAVLMEYYTFIRPVELTRLRVGNVEVARKRIYIPAAVSKNYRDYAVGLNTSLCELFEELELSKYPSEWYLFGKGMRPGPVKGDGRMFRDKFFKVREALGWGYEKQFYGLKDSGIRDLANAAGIVVARDQARHTDVSTTNRYLISESLTVHVETLTFRGAL